MAITSELISAKLRLADSKNKSVCTYTGIDPMADPYKFSQFSQSVSNLRNKSIGFRYLLVENELTDDNA